MRLEIPACGVTLLLVAGCFGPVSFSDEPGGWRVFDSAIDGMENAKLVSHGEADTFDFSFEGASEFGHKAYYEAPLRAGETLVLSFRSEIGPQSTVTLRGGDEWQDYECADPTTEPRPTNASVMDAWASGYVLRDVGRCLFQLTLARDVAATNGINLVWEATTIAFDERDRGPGGGARLTFQAKRT